MSRGKEAPPFGFTSQSGLKQRYWQPSFDNRSTRVSSDSKFHKRSSKASLVICKFEFDSLRLLRLNLIPFVCCHRLNIYEFQRIQYGPNKGGYAHPQLVRGRPELLSKMQRIFVPRKRPVVIKEQTTPETVQSCAPTRVYSSNTPLENVDLNNTTLSARPTSKNPIEEAHVWHEPLPELVIPESPLMCNDNTSLGPSGFLEDMDLSLFEVRDLVQESLVDELPGEDWLFNLVDSEFSSSESSCCANQPQYDGSYESLWIPTAEEPVRSYQGTLSLSTDQDRSSTPISEDGSQCSINEDLSRSEAVFPQKLHKMLEDADSKGFHTVVSWINGGSAFHVHDVSAFVESVMPLYFNQSKYPSFRRQLNLYGFTRVPSAIHGSYFAHRCFLQENPELCNQIVRTSSKSPSSSSPKQ